MLDQLKKACHYLTEGIWTKDPAEYGSKFMRWFSGQMQVFIYTIRIFGQNQMVVRSAGLTYFTLLAIVPLMAVAFGIMKGFGDEGQIEDQIEHWLGGLLPHVGNLSEQIMEWARNMVEGARGGWIAAIGSVVFLWSVILVFMNVENSFNYIWEVRRTRSIARKISDYISVMILGPVLWLVFAAVGGQVEASLDSLVRGTFLWPLLSAIKALIPLVTASLILTLVYKVIPNTQVKFAAALKAAVIAGVALVVVQIFYAHGQSALSRYNAVYGGFAAVPLLFIWLNICWQIVMFGAELSFGYQNVDRYRFERQSENVSYDYRRKIILLVMHRIAVNFVAGREQLDSERLSRSLNIPVRLIRDALFELEQAGLLVSVENEKSRAVRYYPAQDMNRMRIYDVIRAVETCGVAHFDLAEDSELLSLERLFDHLIDERKHSQNNVRLLDIEETKARGN
jgi:membrane protein